MNVDNLVKFSPKIENNKLIIFFDAEYKDVTNLRLIKFLDELDKLFSDFYNDKIEDFYFVFNIDNLNIRTNFSLFKDFANFFKGHEELLLKKLKFTVIQCKNNIFKLFFSLFKQYYIPVKPLYLCSNFEEVQECLFNKEKRDKFPNICNLLEKN